MNERELPGGLVVREARTFAQRTRGLARRDTLAPEQALQILRCRSVHTFGMRFALDLVWLDARDAVIRVDHDVAPRRVRSCLRARSVLETAAGRGDAFAAVWPG